MSSSVQWQAKIIYHTTQVTECILEEVSKLLNVSSRPDKQISRILVASLPALENTPKMASLGLDNAAREALIHAGERYSRLLRCVCSVKFMQQSVCEISSFRQGHRISVCLCSLSVKRLSVSHFDICREGLQELSSSRDGPQLVMLQLGRLTRDLYNQAGWL